MKKRILITTARFGSGHIMATDAIVTELKKHYQTEIVVDTFDFSEGGNETIETFNQKMYSFTAQKMPTVYRTYASMMDSPKLLRNINKFFSLVGSKTSFEKKLQDFCPDLVLSVFPVTNRVIGKYKKKYNFKFITCLTDLTSLHNYWIAPEIDEYIVPLKQSVAPLETLYVPHERIKVIGYPTREVFFAEKDQSALQKKLKIKPEKFVVTYLLHTAPEPYAPEVCHFLDSNPEIQALLICGKNKALAKKFRKKYPNSQVLDFVKNMDEYMRVSNLVIGKAGAGFVMEAFAVGVPLLITSYIAPQEQGNVELMLDQKCGFLAGSAEDIIRQIEQIQTFTPAQIQKIRDNQHRLTHPDSVKNIAKHLANVI